MTRQANHIISKFKWENSFDQKEKASELQQRLSSWSNTKMQKEISNIFDRVCPSTQTWSIQSLTLDLGKIDYENLEEDLSLKLFHVLSDKLIDIMLQADKQGHNIELLHSDSSQINMLGHYFVTGVMPWNYKITDSSVNKMMSFQFKNNKQKVIQMLYEVGIVNENVRKRMAWQLDELIIIKIIEGLETGNHQQIIKFSEELTQIQQQETLVPANKNDFKKNLWFWILNYLFTDRGTIFNKVSFMKSSIQQMSNHYNVAYFELLDMIGLAINHINVNSNTRADFIVILNLLTQENESLKTKKELAIISEPDYWLTLTQLFKAPSVRKDSDEKSAFNELVLVLSKENKTKFRQLFSSFGDSMLFWTPVVGDLKNEALESIFHAVLPVKSEMLIESIYFMDKLCTEMNFKIERNTLWEIGIRFILSHQNAPFDNKSFLNYTVNELSKKNNELRENVLNQLTSVKIPSSSKTIATLEIYTNLTAILSDEISEKQETFFTPLFHDLLTQLSLQIQSHTVQKTAIIAVQKSIIKYIRLQPAQALDIFIQYKDKKALVLLFPYILNKHHAHLFVKKSNKPKSYLLQTLERIIWEVNSSHSKGSLALPILDNLYLIGFRLMVLHPEYNSLRFLEAVLEKLLMLITPSQKPFFDLFLETLFTHKKISNTSFADSDLVKIRTKLVLKKISPLVEKAKQIHPTYPVQTISQEKQDTIVIDGQDIAKTTLYEWIEDCIKNEVVRITRNNQVFKLKHLLRVVLEINPKALCQILSHIDITESRINMLRSSLDWRNFSLWIASDSHIALPEAMETLRSLYDFVTHFMSVQNTIEIQKAFWKQTWEIIKQNKDLASIQKSFINYWLNQIFKEEEYINSNTIIQAITAHTIRISPILKKILMEYNTTFSNIVSNTTTAIHEDMKHCEQLGLLTELYISLIIEKKIPAWYRNTQNSSVTDLFEELLDYYPTSFITLFKQNSLPQLQKQQLYESIDFKKIIPIIHNFNKSKQQLLSILDRFYMALGQLSVSGISAKEIQNILFKKVIMAWTANNWSIVSVENSWQELIWEICYKRNIGKKELFAAIEKIKYSFPPALQISFEQLSKSDTPTSNAKEPNISLALKKQMIQKNTATITQGSIAVKNAGIVLLNNYIAMLIERLGLLDGEQFKDKAAQLDAVHYIQYVITGLTKTEEALLPLNKVLCGLPIDTPVMESINITEDQKKLINGLISAAISHWPSLGDTSVQGFRGNWLVRDGLLIEKEERWELTVEKRVYDLLIYKSPFSFTIIRYPWMKKPLHVTWPY